MLQRYLQQTHNRSIGRGSPSNQCYSGTFNKSHSWSIGRGSSWQPHSNNGMRPPQQVKDTAHYSRQRDDSPQTEKNRTAKGTLHRIWPHHLAGLQQQYTRLRPQAQANSTLSPNRKMNVIWSRGEGLLNSKRLGQG
jgi:hypothetical protein